MLKSNHIRLRALSKADLPALVAIANEEDVVTNLTSAIPFPLREADLQKHYDALDATSTTEYGYAVEHLADKAVIGSCFLFLDPKNGLADLSLSLGAGYRNKGLGEEVLRLLVDFSFQEANANKVKLTVYEFNRRAQRCYEKVGFKRECAFRQHIYREGRYWDMYAMAILREEWEQN